MSRLVLAAGVLLCGAAPGLSQPAATSGIPLTLPFSATGNEPGWRLDIADGRITLLADYGSTRLEMRAGEPQAIAGGRRYAGNADGHVLVVTVIDRPCEDSMTGMPRPQTVEVTLDEQLLKGCGGDPAALLRGAPWVVEAIDTGVVVDGSRVTLVFDGAGRLSGAASCNTYAATYTITGEGLKIDKAATTRKACAPTLMNQEQAFLELLAAVERFEMAGDGVLILHAAGGRMLRARR